MLELITTDLIFKGTGVIGILLLVSGLLSKKETTETKRFLLGGVFLAIYSWYIQDPVFIVLQLIYVAVAGWKLYTLRITK